MALLTTIAKAARKSADEWDEAAWLKENPRPFPDVKIKDHTPEQRAAYKKWEYEKGKAKKGPAPEREISDQEALWLENNPRPEGDPRTHPAVKTWMNQRSMVRNGQLDPSKPKPTGKLSDEEWAERKAQSAERRRERRRRYASEYRKNNRELANAQGAKYRASKLQRTPDYSNDDAINRIYEQAGLLSKATGTPHHVDHVIPLQGENVSGLHVPGNLMIVPDNLNQSKSNAFTPGDDPMRFNDVAQQNIAEANEMGLFSFLSKNADKAGLAGVAGVLAAGQSEDADAGLLHAGARGARDFTGRKPGDYKAPNLSKKGRSMPVVAQWSDELTKLKSVGADSHTLENKLLDYLKGDGSNSNLHNWPGFAKRIDGGVNGPFYLNGMDVFYEELVELMPQHEDIIRGVISRRQGGGKGRDFNQYESKHSAQNAQARNIGGGGVLDESAYQQKVRRAESDPSLRVPRYTDPIVRRNENTFVDPKTGRKKARQVSFAVGDPGTGAQFAQALFDNYETGKQAQMDQAGLTKDPMYEYGTLLPWKQNIVTGEGSPAVPDFLRTMLGGIFGVKSGLQQGIVNPNDLGDIFL